MPTTKLSDQDVARAERIWTEYQQRHDVSAWHGHAAGIDPVTQRIWFGESAAAVVRAMQADGIDHPLFFVRVGFPAYLRKKGGRR